MNFFYDLNKKLNSIGAAPESTQLNERDEGKHNNATTGFAALAKKAGKEYGSKAAGERVAGAVHAKMARAGKLEEGHCSTCNCSPCTCNEGNAFSGAVVKAKRDGIQPGEKVKVGGKTYPVKEQGMSEAKGKKPDFLDLDKDGNKNEPMKKAAADKKNITEDQLDRLLRSEARIDKLSPKALQDYVDDAQQNFNEIDRLAKSEGMGTYKKRKAAEPGDEYYHPDHWTTTSQDKRVAGLEKARARGVVPSKPNFGKNISQSERDREDSRTPPGMMREQERKTTHGTEVTKGNITTHTRNYEPDVEDDDDVDAEPRKAGRPKGTKHATGARGPGANSKLLQLKAIREEGDTCPHCGAKKVVDERSVSQAQAHMMAGAAHNPKFAKKVGVKQSVAKEFNKADTGKDIGKLPKKVKEADAAPAAEKAPSNKYGFGKGIYDSLNRQVDNLITEGMSVTVNMSTDDTGQPHKDITVHADGDDAAKLAELLNLAGIHQSEQSCSSCGQSPCDCGGQMVDENSPSNEPDPVFASVDQVAGPNTGGGIDGPHTERNENNPGDNPMSYEHPTPNQKGYMPGATNTYNESKQADLGMSLYKELQQFKGK